MIFTSGKSRLRERKKKTFNRNIEKPESIVKSESKKKIYSLVPLNLFQTWSTLKLPPKMRQNVELLKKQNPEFKHYLYDDTMCREFIKKNFCKDVLYSFDKLKPGAFKADLWRYCILYIHGGIYLDIKFRCINNFRLIELTDKEYFVRDRICEGEEGIYQALLCCFPKNKILYKCIHQIVEYVKNNYYGHHPLFPTGPSLVARYFTATELKQLEVINIGHKITVNNNIKFVYYPEYRDEQIKTQTAAGHYYIMWNKLNIYFYPTLSYYKRYNISRIINKEINNKINKLYSGTPNIIELSNNTYLVVMRWINYSYHEEGYRNFTPNRWISINSIFKLDSNFKNISKEVFLNYNHEKNEYNFQYYGIEDIRLFKNNNNYYFIGSTFDNNRVVKCSVSSMLDVDSINDNINNNTDNEYKIEKNIILPNNYDFEKRRITEKNWSFFNYNEKLHIVYNWYPLQIGKIDYTTNKMDITEIKYNTPKYFETARGSTCGQQRDDEIWFVLHKAQQNICDDKLFYNYQHFFAIFDLQMNLIRYSELFKLGDEKVEFCTGFILEKKLFNIII